MSETPQWGEPELDCGNTVPQYVNASLPCPADHSSTHFPTIGIVQLISQVSSTDRIISSALVANRQA